jgi:hypothetical protein
MEVNAKFHHQKKLTCKVTLRQVFICLRPRTPYHHSITHCIRVYLYLFTRGKGEGRELNQREGERDNRGEYRLQSLVENTNMTECTQEIGYKL